MKNFLCIDATRDTYRIEDVHTLTVGELIAQLEELASECGEDAPVILSHDCGYTYGGLSYEKVYIDTLLDD